MSTNLLSVEILRLLLHYDTETGAMLWKERPRTRFNSDRYWRRWNSAYAGKEALISVDREGYRKGEIFTKSYKAHRVAWAIYHGEWPASSIDHINGNPADNRISNLRCVSALENQKNLKRRCDNMSGRVGVRFCKIHRKWQAKIGHQGKRIHLGSFASFDEACAARDLAEKQYGFHSNHGRRA